MSLKGFICPDSQRILKDECLDKCRLERRCLTFPTLWQISQDRVFNGQFSTTQLLQPYRISYLKITTDYWIIPEDRAYQLLGIRHHAVLERSARLNGLMTELKLKGDTEITGILDLLEPHETIPGAFVLTDYKTWGAYKVASFDSRNDAVLQLNHYRVLANPILQPDYIERLQLQVTIRDGGTQIARQYNIKERIKILPVPVMQDKDVISLFSTKAKELRGFLDRNELPPLCNETWKGKRCQSFCEVYESCPEGRRVHNLPI